MGKGSPTLAANEGLAATVCPLVGDEVPPEGEALPTHGTTIRLFACMNTLMSLQVSTTLETLRTERAGEQLMPHVSCWQNLRFCQHCGHSGVLSKCRGLNYILYISSACLFCFRLNYILNLTSHTEMKCRVFRVGSMYSLL